MSATEMRAALDAAYTRPQELPPVEQPAANDAGPVRRVCWAKEIKSMPPPRWLVPGILQENCLAMLFGEPGSGKSTISVDVGMHIATGMNLQGEPCKKGVVLHVAGEDGVGLKKRIAAFCKRNNVEDPSYGILPSGLDLADPDSVDRLIADIKAAREERGQPIELVIIDTLARCADIDENNSREMNRAVRGCDRVRHETGAAVLLVHHSGKDAKKGARGSSALKAAVDTELEVRIQGSDRGFWVSKQRNEPSNFGWQFTLQPIEIWRNVETGRIESACTVEHAEQSRGSLFGKSSGKRVRIGTNQKALRDALEKAYRTGIDSWSQDELRELAGGTLPEASRSTIRSAMSGMTKHNVLVLAEGRYWLVKPPRRPAAPSKSDGDPPRPEGRAEA